MALTNTTLFNQITCNISYGVLTRVTWQESDRTFGSIIFNGSYPTDTDDLANLAVLQTIHASDDGFLDANSVALVVDITGDVEYSVTLDTLKFHNLPNIFVDGDWEEWVARNRLINEESEVTEDADTETKTFKIPGVIQSKSTTPASSSFSFALGNKWTVTQLAGNDFRLTLRINYWKKLHLTGWTPTIP